MSNEFFNFDYHYKIYLEKCKDLAKSIIIKSDYTAVAMNDIALNKNAVVDENDKSSWKYYKNVSGEYHYLDEIMRVVSVDTLEEIDFTIENLEKHRATKKAYRYGTLLYQELLTRYPDQELLILGILYPADKEKAIHSEDGTILSYPDGLIEKNEYSFLKDLQEWINGYKLKREAPVYGFSDELWPITNLGLMYLNLLPAIMTIRKSKCKTNEAHSYHVRRYLASHGFLDEYLDAMTLKQSLRFYMNINWIDRNIGKTETQTWLIREAMTARNLPIAEYNFKHSSENQPGRIYPTNFFRKKSLNGLENITDVDDLTLHQLLLKEDPLARENPVTRMDHEVNIGRQLENSLSNTLKTKVLESKVTDYTDADYEKLSKMLLNLWIDWSVSGLYRSIVYFTDAVNGERLQLRAKEAMILYLYSYYKGHDIHLEKIPDVLVECVPLKGFIKEKDLIEMSEWKMTDVVNYTPVEKSFIKKLLSSRVIPKSVVSISEFYDLVKEINVTTNKQLQWAYDEDNYLLRSYKEAMVYRMFSDHWVELYPKENGIAKSYSTWLEEENIDLSKYGKEDYKRLADSILKSATGYDLHSTKSVRAIHRAMLGLLKQLSSYSVQYIRETNESDLYILENNPPSLKYPNSYGKERQFYDNDPPKILDHSGKGKEIHDGSTLINLGKTSVYEKGKSQVKLKSDPDIHDNQKAVIYAFGESDIEMSVKVETFDNPDDLVYIPGMESFAKLSIEERSKIKDVYGNNFYYLDPCKTNKTIVLSHPGGFKYQTKREIQLERSIGLKYRMKK